MSALFACASIFGGGALLVGLFASLCLGLIAVGAFGTRAMLSTERITNRVMSQMLKEKETLRTAYLDRLNDRLKADGDPRPEALLRDLRLIMDQNRTDLRAPDAVVSRQMVEVATKSDRLYQSCIRSLERTAELWDIAQRMATPIGRETTMQRRERLVLEVEASVRHLGKIFDGVQSLGLVHDDVNEMGRIRGELDRTLESARRIEERMQQIDDELAPSDSSLQSKRILG